LASSISRIVLIAILGGGALFAASSAVLGGDDAVRNVAMVHHSGLDSVPRVAESPTRMMLASYYGRTLEGRPMANGHLFDADDYTAAHRSLPFGTKLEVSYGGESVRVIITDRGPYVAGRDLDLSLAAAQQIGLTGPGEAPVRVRIY
jgi:rare lipoprotein A